MMPAQWGEVAFTRAPALVVGHGVVQVAWGGRTPAPRRGTGRGAGPDQVLQPPARFIAGVLVAVVADLAGQPGDRDRQVPGQEHAGSGPPGWTSPPGRRTVAA